MQSPGRRHVHVEHRRLVGKQLLRRHLGPVARGRKPADAAVAWIVQRVQRIERANDDLVSRRIEQQRAQRLGVRELCAAAEPAVLVVEFCFRETAEPRARIETVVTRGWRGLQRRDTRRGAQTP